MDEGHFQHRTIEIWPQARVVCGSAEIRALLRDSKPELLVVVGILVDECGRVELVVGERDAPPPDQSALVDLDRLVAAVHEAAGRVVAELVGRDPISAGTPGAGLPASLCEVAELIAEGLSDKEIADRTGRPLSTVRTYVARLYQRTGLRSRAALTKWWWMR